MFDYVNYIILCYVLSTMFADYFSDLANKVYYYATNIVTNIHQPVNRHLASFSF